ncbi:uncharacterized protein LOC119553225 isoform X6 [Drosophila subpulchrella]|uniref:uncharacterized protein LOC119553225 isoform X6 n=1 Tax=Drosophila subpulchrella TaxID=1486046 RepID=UPI0018A196BD|nr:uncharacterized protein LOC119553225 isoform X6 [Drosophila subpulchrella]
MDIELPYMAEYARSGRANCKGCKCSIPKDNLRIAVMVQTLGMIELGGSHTGIYMKNKILEVLDDYGISLDQIYSVTSDNGRNMIKAVQVLNDATEESLFEEDTESENLLNELDTIELANIHLVRCAAHTLQLCVFDVNKAKEIADKISSCRTLCKSLRTETYRRILIENQRNIPSLDVATRWNSTYLMLKRLLDLKDFLATQSYICVDPDWDWIETYIDAFSDTYQATLKLQDKHLVYSEFFVVWMELKLKCENSHNLIKKKLSAQKKIRESKLLENEALLAAIYMDPRVNCMLTNYQKSLAKANLKKIAFRLFELKQAQTPNVPALETPVREEMFDSSFSSTLSTASSSEEKSLFSAFLDDFQTVSESKKDPVSAKLVKIYADIENFDVTFGRLPLNSNILEFFNDLQLKLPHISALAQVVLATPATQVSVERAFSALHFILSERRSSISAENLNALLVIKLNT